MLEEQQQQPDSDFTGRWVSQMSQCPLCRHRYAAVYPEGLLQMECPQCETMQPVDQMVDDLWDEFYAE